MILMLLVAAAFALLSCVALSITQAEPVAENLAAGLAALSMGLLAADLTLPLSYKLGPERARPYLYAIIFIPVILLVLAGQMGWLKGLSDLPEETALALFSVLPLIPLAGLPVSYLISCRVVEKKEF